MLGRGARRAGPAVALFLSAACAHGPVAAARGQAPDSTAVTKHRMFPLPIVFYQPETKWGGGAALLHTYRTARDARTSSDGLFIVYTQRKQFSLSLSGERFTPMDRYRLSAELSWSRFPDLFYGIGNDTEVSEEEEVTLRSGRLALDVRRGLTRSLFVGATALLQTTDAIEREEGGKLLSGSIRGSGGGELRALGTVVAWDGRDRVYSPSRGGLAAVFLRHSDPAIGSTFESTRLDLDTRVFHAAGGGHVLAGQLIATVGSGEPAYFDLATLGGANTVRGYFEGRFRDRNRVAVQAEHRFPIWRRLGGAFFAAAGEVMRRPGEARIDGFHPAAGAGIRFLLSPEEGTRLRIDFAWGDGDSGVYFAFNEAF
jgi:outer membrane protein assembly factor BamA